MKDKIIYKPNKFTWSIGDELVFYKYRVQPEVLEYQKFCIQKIVDLIYYNINKYRLEILNIYNFDDFMQDSIILCLDGINKFKPYNSFNRKDNSLKSFLSIICRGSIADYSNKNLKEIISKTTFNIENFE